jgi:hypothetical protein
MNMVKIALAATTLAGLLQGCATTSLNDGPVAAGLGTRHPAVLDSLRSVQP